MPIKITAHAQNALIDLERRHQIALTEMHICDVSASYSLLHNGVLLGSLEIEHKKNPTQCIVYLWTTGYPLKKSRSMYGALEAMRNAAAQLPDDHPISIALARPPMPTTRLSIRHVGKHLHDWRPLLKAAKIILDT